MTAGSHIRSRLSGKKCFIVAAILVLAVITAPADPLGDLRATLQKLQSSEPLHARVEIKTRRSGGESHKQNQSESVSTVLVEIGPGGFNLTWSPDQIRQSRKAAWEAISNPDAVRSDLASLKSLEPGDALNLVDAGDPLRRSLEKAVLLEEKASAPYKTKSARLLVFRIQLTLDEEERKALKSSEAVLKLWLDDDGVPIAMDRDIQAKFSKLLIGFRIHEHDTREYQQVGGRLMVTRWTKDSSGSGLGHTEETHIAATVTLMNP